MKLTTTIIAAFLTLTKVSSIEAFNLTSAECFNPKEVAAINTYMEWSAFAEDKSDGYCYDNHGTGYPAGHNFVSCSSCIQFLCDSRPCDDRDGSKFKMFWRLVSVASQCCQDCQGKIYPPNRVVSTTSLEDKCDTVEQAVCKTVLDDAGTTTGTIEVSYTAGNCCLDEGTWSPAGTTILEKETCSARTCHQGRPAQWYRDTKYQGGCGCCEYQASLHLPGDLPSGTGIPSTREDVGVVSTRHLYTCQETCPVVQGYQVPGRMWVL